MWINWTPYNKPHSYIKSGDSTSFLYDAGGNRVREKVAGGVERHYIRDVQGNIQAIYEDGVCVERPLYGASRLGRLTSLQPDATATREYRQTEITEYEVPDHLGNVRAVVGDVRRTTGEVERSELYSYYPYGFLREGGSYRYGYNGMQREDAIAGAGNIYTTEFRQLDTRYARWLSIDPETSSFPWQSAYIAMDGNPIMLMDKRGNSTHTDREGNVIRIHDDNNYGVFQHDVGENFVGPLRGSVGTKRGETHTLYGFADFGAYEQGILKPDGASKIDFGSKWATEQVSNILNSDPSAIRYAFNARSEQEWDIKTSIKPDGTINQMYGSLLFGKYASARDAGNFAAGAVAQKSNLPNLLLDYGFGTYNLSKNNVKQSLKLMMRDFGFTVNMTVSFGLPTGIVTGRAIMKTVGERGEDRLSQMGIDAGKKYMKYQQKKQLNK